MSEEVAQFGNIFLGGKSSKGVLKLSPHGFAWKNKTGTSETIEASSIIGADWVRTGTRIFLLELKLKGEVTVRFDGFMDQDYLFLSKFLKDRFNVELKTLELSTKGWNWGDVEFQGSTMIFNVAGKRAFGIPLTDVSRCSISNTVSTKNDVSLEFHQYDTVTDEQGEQLIEMRFHVPNTGNDAEKTSAQEFHEKVLARADIVASSGKGLCEFKEVHLLTPRGRYSIEMFSSSMKLKGKTFDYKIPYTNIARLFQLPKPDQKYVFFVISLDPPIKQGLTRYPHLVIQFPIDEEIEIALNIDKSNTEQSIREKFPEFNGETIKGPSYQTMSRVFKAVTGKKATMPKTFKSHFNASAIKCSVKASDGFLYPLERSFFFVYKPALHLHFEEIAFVEFARVSSGSAGANTRTFDLIVTMNSTGIEYQFTGIQRSEYDNLINFIIAKKIRIKDHGGDVVEVDEEETEAKIGKRKSRKPGEQQQQHELYEDDEEQDEDEESSEDEDFVAEEEEEVPEDFDENYQAPNEPKDDDDDDEDEEEEGQKKELASTSNTSTSKEANREKGAHSIPSKEKSRKKKTKTED